MLMQRKMRISINHSPMKDLRRLRGIGAVLASRITETRRCSPFSDSHDLVDRVKGISEQTVQSWNQQTDVVVAFEQVDSDYSSDSFLRSTLAVTAVGAVFAVIIILLAVNLTDFAFTKSSSETSGQNGPARNHTIYFECLGDNDCALGQKCYPGKLHPREGPLELFRMTAEELNQAGIWTKSKFGFEQVTGKKSGLPSGIYRWALESGRRCWNISGQIGSECGDKHLQICDEEANLTCIYGKCRKTDDPALLNYDVDLSNTRGLRFISFEDAGCDHPSVQTLTRCLMIKVLGLPRPDRHWSVEGEYPSRSEQERIAEIRRRYGVYADRSKGPTTVINKLFRFPKIFGIQIQMDKLLETHFGSREAAEAVYIKAMGEVNRVYRQTFGFTFHIQSFCWMSSSLLGTTMKDHLELQFDEPPAREQFKAFTTDNVNNTNIVMFTRYMTHKEWLKSKYYGWACPGCIWDSKLKSDNWIPGAPQPAIVHIMHIEKRSIENLTITIAHELAHVFGAVHTFELPYSLGPQFKDNCQNGGNGTLLSYCDNRELKFYPGSVKYIHEYMNQVDRHRLDDDFVHVFGNRAIRYATGDFDNTPLMGHVKEIRDNPCQKVSQLFEQQAMDGQRRGTIGMDASMGIIIALAVAVVTVVLVSAYKPQGDGSVSINRSSLKDLTKLKYIGDVKASWIIAERENAKRGGTFKDFEDLIRRVDGITKRLVQVWMKEGVVVTID